MSDSGEGQAFSAVEDAFACTTSLPRPTRRGEIICPLGTDHFDWFIYDLLCNAGITVELIEEDDTEKGCPYGAAQIVDPVDMHNTMKKATSLETIVPSATRCTRPSCRWARCACDRLFR